MGNFRDAYIGEFNGRGSLVDCFMNGTGGVEEMLERLRYQFDYHVYGRDALRGEEVAAPNRYY
ncbi:TPA: hypothetical protein ACXNC8_001684 [Stenotrophomonas maltophilia]